MRLFSKVSIERNNQNVKLPKRATAFSAAYDFYTPVAVTLRPMVPRTVFTGVKCYMDEKEYLQISVRSGLASRGVILAQGVGIIDADYVDNTTNEGDIGFTLVNLTDKDITLDIGSRIGQGIFLEYKTTDDDAEHTKGMRAGGFGSTGV